MEDLLIKSAKIIDPDSPHNGKTADILIENGKISAIGKIKEDKKTKVIRFPNLYISPGWFDMQVSFCDPGYEYKEDIFSGIQAAAAGGFTGVACMPSTSPPLQTKAGIEYVLGKAAGAAVDVFPVGAVTCRLEGNELTEMYDMHCSGAVAFSDDKNPISGAGVLSRALQYVKAFDGLIMVHPEDKSISLNGDMNEGVMNVKMGLKGIPALAEELMVARNIHLAEYTGSKLHLSAVSTGKSVELVREAKRRKTKVTAGVPAYALELDETELKSFDTNLKLNPPLRPFTDVKALRAALADNVIDVICSDHRPEDEENKKREFDSAAFGMTGIESAFGVIHTSLKKIISIEDIIRKISINPRKILNIPSPCIAEGQHANITLFNPEMKWVFSEDKIRSKSKNTPFTGKQFTGKPLGIFNKGKLLLQA